MKPSPDEFVLDLVKDCLDRLDPGNPIPATSAHEIDLNVYLIASSPKVKGGDSNNATKRSRVRRAVSVMRKNGSDVSMKALNSAISEIKRGEFQSPEREFRVIYPINVKTVDETSIRKSIALEDRLRILSKAEIGEIGRQPANESIVVRSDPDRAHRYMHSAKWIELRVTHRNAEQGFYEAERRIEMLRATANFLLMHHKYTMQSGPQAWSRIPCPWFMFLIDTENETTSSYSNSANGSDRVAAPQSSIWPASAKFMDAIRSMHKCQLRDTIEEALLLYGVALDSSTRVFTFTMLWAILEMLLPDTNRRSDTLKALYGTDAKKKRRLVDVLYHQRNQIIHQGRVDAADEDEINHLNSLVHDVLFAAVELAAKVTTTSELVQAIGLFSDYAKKREQMLRIMDAVGEALGENRAGK